MTDARRIEPISPPRDASVSVPGSRSITNRALVCAALATGTSRLRGWLDADDTIAMREGLVALGATIRDEGGDLVVEGTAGRVFPPRAPIDCRLSGSTIRFLSAVAALADGWVTLDGQPPLRKRPLGSLSQTLQTLGVKVKGAGDHAPITICGPMLERQATLDASVSGQFLSGLLLAGPCAKDGLRIDVGVVASEPFVEMTRRVMEMFGARTTKLWAKVHEVADTSGFAVGSTYRASYLVSASGYTAAEYEIEPDLMSASYLFAAAAITGGSVLVRGTRRDSMQGDVAVLVALEEMGCTVEQRVDGIHVTGGALHGITFDVASLPDMAPTLAVVACFATGPTTITGTRTLRVKESDRAAALEVELTKLGARVTVAEDEITIEPPGVVHPARIETYDDHRIAMAFSVAGLRASGIEIIDPGCVAKTFPGFYDVLEQLV